MGVTEALVAIVIAQTISTIVISVVGARRAASVPGRAREGARRGRAGRSASFVLQSSIATGVISLRTTLIPLILGVVSGTTQVGLFRIATTPQTGLAAASSPARLVLLTEQTRDWEKGARSSVLAGVRSYSKWAGAIMVVAVPVFFVAMPWLVGSSSARSTTAPSTRRGSILLAAAIHFALGWTKSLPVTIGRPRLRIVTHGLETIVAIPLVARARCRMGRDGSGGRRARLDGRVRPRLARRDRAPAGRGATPPRERAGPRSSREGGRRLRDLAPDPGGPASHAPALADFLTERGHDVQVVTTAAVEPTRRPYPVRWAPRRSPLRHVRVALLVREAARRADVVYATSMIRRAAIGSRLARRRSS